MGFVLGGLMQGLGAGLKESAAQKREDALLKLRRQYQQEDAATARADTIATETRAEERDIRGDVRDGFIKTGLLELAAKHKRLENETEQAYKERLLRIGAGYESRHIAERAGAATALERLQQQGRLTAAQLDDARTAEREATARGEEVGEMKIKRDGTLIVFNKKGEVMRRSSAGSFNAPNSGSDDEPEGGGSIAAARAGRGGATPPARPTDKPVARRNPAAAKPADTNADARAQALATLGTVYANATPDRYPGLFRDGKKIPMAEAKQLIQQRYK